MIIVDFELRVPDSQSPNLNEPAVFHEWSYQLAECGCVKSPKKRSKTSSPVLRHQRGLIPSVCLQMSEWLRQVGWRAIIRSEKCKIVKEMFTLWSLIVVHLTLGITTINSIILHEHHVMKERNFGNELWNFQWKVWKIWQQEFTKFKVNFMTQLKTLGVTMFSEVFRHQVICRGSGRSIGNYRRKAWELVRRWK